MTKYFLFAFLTFGLLWSCTDGELQTPGDEYLTGDQDGSYSVDMNGVFKNFGKVTQATSSSGGSDISGTSSAGGSISITLPQVLATGNYTELNGAMITIMTQDGVFTNIGMDGAPLSFNLSITSVNNSQGFVSGIFSGSVMNLTTDEIVNLTNGKFVKIQFTPVVNIDRVLEAKFNDELFDFSTNANAQGITTGAIISGENTNQVQTLSLMIPGGIGVDTFTEEDLVEIKVNLGTTNNPSDFYSNYDPVSDTYLPVVLTITSIDLGEGDTTGRVKGTFSGTITKFTNGVPGEEIIVTEGKINVPIEIPEG
ncbi:MAG: hypothetical protein WCY77_07590 [Weeksellaceae bacterium]